MRTAVVTGKTLSMDCFGLAQIFLEDAVKSEERDKKCSAFVHRRGPSCRKCDTRAPLYIPRSLEGRCDFLKRDTVDWLYHFHHENRLEAADVIFIFIVHLTPSNCLLA